MRGALPRGDAQADPGLTTGSAFLCASDRQRDLWLGVLSSLGRIGYDEYAADPTLERLVAVVPFGVDPEPPQAESAR